MLISFAIPVYNPGNEFKRIIKVINDYALHTQNNVEIIVVDSQSNDGSTNFLMTESNVKLFKINQNEFNHGGTRNFAYRKSHGEYIIFLTQDVIPEDYHCFINILQSLIANSKVGSAYGRQLPKNNADFYGESARKINYPETSLLKSIQDKKELGIKTVFISNSFAAYRRIALDEVGGFPEDTIMNEDQYVGAKMIMKGWIIAYEAEACVKHSHNYTCIQEFKRYFDIGVFYGHEDWILKVFSKAEGEGIKFVFQQIRALIKEKKIYFIPNLVVRTGMKYLGYKMGMHERLFPVSFKKRLSMNSRYWVNNN